MDGLVYWLEVMCGRCCILVGGVVWAVWYIGWRCCVGGVVYWLNHTHHTQ